MTKNELAEQVASRNGLAASQARQVVETVIEVGLRRAGRRG